MENQFTAKGTFMTLDDGIASHDYEVRFYVAGGSVEVMPASHFLLNTEFLQGNTKIRFTPQNSTTLADFVRIYGASGIEDDVRLIGAIWDTTTSAYVLTNFEVRVRYDAFAIFPEATNTNGQRWNMPRIAIYEGATEDPALSTGWKAINSRNAKLEHVISDCQDRLQDREHGCATRRISSRRSTRRSQSTGGRSDDLRQFGHACGKAERRGRLRGTGGDQTERFVRDGIREMEQSDKPVQDRDVRQVKSMQPGDRIAIKSTYVRKNGINFDNNRESGLGEAIKAIVLLLLPFAAAPAVAQDMLFPGGSSYTYPVTTRASYRRRVRRERFEWPPEDCIPGSPWTGGSLRFGNRLRRTFGCGSTRRLSA